MCINNFISRILKTHSCTPFRVRDSMLFIIIFSSYWWISMPGKSLLQLSYWYIWMKDVQMIPWWTVYIDLNWSKLFWLFYRPLLYYIWANLCIFGKIYTICWWWSNSSIKYRLWLKLIHLVKEGKKYKDYRYKKKKMKRNQLKKRKAMDNRRNVISVTKIIFTRIILLSFPFVERRRIYSLITIEINIFTGFRLKRE